MIQTNSIKIWTHLKHSRDLTHHSSSRKNYADRFVPTGQSVIERRAALLIFEMTFIYKILIYGTSTRAVHRLWHLLDQVGQRISSINSALFYTVLSLL